MAAVHDIARTKRVRLVTAWPVEGEAHKVKHAVFDAAFQIRIKEPLKHPMMLVCYPGQIKTLRVLAVLKRQSPVAHTRPKRLVDSLAVLTQKGRMTPLAVRQKLNRGVKCPVMASPDEDFHGFKTRD